MIIECINCSKKFDVNSDLIPSSGRTIQCGSCNHTWFFKKDESNDAYLKKLEISADITDNSRKKVKNKKKLKSHAENQKFSLEDTIVSSEKKGSEIVEYAPKSNFTFGKFLSFILVIIISFIAIILLLDTFKKPLFNFFPSLEFVLFSLYETLKDIKLFIKDLF
ncbi:MAG: zinc-ribbon domain-containing protein [Candidatus Pelagibacter sp.]